MTETGLKEIAASGVADALRKSPIVFGLVLAITLETAVMAWLALSITTDVTGDRAALSARNAELTQQLVECYRDRRAGLLDSDESHVRYAGAGR